MENKKSISALIWSSADKVLTNGVALVISIILARLIAPSEYGVIATASIFTVLLTIFVEPGMTSALIQKKNTDKLDYSTILVFNLVIGILLYAILFSTSGVIAHWFELPALSPVIRVLGFQIVIGSVNSVQIAYVQKNMLFKRYFVCSFSSVVVSACIAIFLAYRGAGVWALVAYNLIRQFVNTLMTYVLFRCRFGLSFSVDRFKVMFPFASKMLVAKFIDQGYVEITQTIISKTYSSTELAFYNKGKSFPDLLINNLNAALSSVMFPFFSTLQDELEKLRASLRAAVKMTSFICIPLLIGLAACAENFIEVALTESWLDCVPFVQLFCLYYIWIPFSNLIWQSLKATGKSNVVVVLEVVKMTLNILTLVFFLWMVRSPIAVALSIVVTYTISFFVECFMAGIHLGYRASEIVVDFVPSLAASICMGLIVLQIGRMNISPVIELILQVVFGIMIYSSIVLVFRFPQAKQLLTLIKKKK